MLAVLLSSIADFIQDGSFILETRFVIFEKGLIHSVPILKKGIDLQTTMIIVQRGISVCCPIDIYHRSVLPLEIDGRGVPAMEVWYCSNSTLQL